MATCWTRDLSSREGSRRATARTASGQELGKVLYEEAAKKQAAAAAQAGPGEQARPPSGEGEAKAKPAGDVIDAEFEAKDS